MKKILVVEDERIVADLLERKLTQQGYLVYVVGDGETAVRSIREKRPDLVLLDMILPKKQGLEVLAEIKKDDILKEIPVIIVSNSGDQEELERAKTLGIVDWLVKTEFDPQEVVDKVNVQLNSTYPAQ